MTSKKEAQDFYKYFRFIIIPVVFIGFYLLAYMIDPYRPWSGFFKRDTTEILSEWIFVSIFCLLITEFSLVLARALDKRVSWVAYPLSRFFLQFSIQIVASIVFLYVYLHLTLFLSGAETRLDDLNSLALRQSFVVSTLLSVLISLIFTGNFFLQQWKAAMLETSNLSLKAAELKQIALESELQSLKMQKLQP